MNALKELFIKKTKDILAIYFTAGYPSLNDTALIINTLEKSGVDFIEIGLPYSDPLADGPTIQKSGKQALDNGMTMDLLFEQLEAVKNISTPMITMGYYNQFLQYGEENFCKKLKDLNISGCIFPDMPVEIYEAYYKDLFTSYGLTHSFLISPQTAIDRVKKLSEASTGFLYMVSSAATTGKNLEFSTEQITYFEKIKELNFSSPRLIGFGIGTHSSYSKACEYANGAIIGSAFINALEKDNIEESTGKFITSILNKS